MFMSPEQARGEDGLDSRSDPFSLGSVLYTLQPAGHLFRADTTLAVLSRVCNDTPRPLAEVNSDVPDWLEALVARLMAKDPARRFQSGVGGRGGPRPAPGPPASDPQRVLRCRHGPAAAAVAGDPTPATAKDPADRGGSPGRRDGDWHPRDDRLASSSVAEGRNEAERVGTIPSRSGPWPRGVGRSRPTRSTAASATTFRQPCFAGWPAAVIRKRLRRNWSRCSVRATSAAVLAVGGQSRRPHPRLGRARTTRFGYAGPGRRASCCAPWRDTPTR